MKKSRAQFITELVNEHSDMILRIAYQHTGSLYDAQDIAQEVFLAALKNDLSRLEPEARKAYIIRCAVNKCNDLHRKRKRHDIISIEDVQPVFEQEERDVLDAVMSLPEKYRDVIYLRYYEGYGVGEIASMLGSNPNTVSSQLSRAREKLREILKEENYADI